MLIFSFFGKYVPTDSIVCVAPLWPYGKTGYGNEMEMEIGERNRDKNAPINCRLVTSVLCHCLVLCLGLLSNGYIICLYSCTVLFELLIIQCD